MKLIKTVTPKFHKDPPPCGALHPDGIGECDRPGTDHRTHSYWKGEWFSPEGRSLHWWTA